MTLPKGWTETIVGDVTDYVSRGKSPKYVEKSFIPVVNQRAIRWSGIEKHHLKFIDPTTTKQWGIERTLREGDILWNSTGTGTIGRAALYSPIAGFERVVADSHVTVVRASEGVLPSFLFKFIKSPTVQDAIIDMQSGSTNQVELSRTAILQTPILLPPTAEQRRIVAKLDALTTLINRARTELARIPTLIALLRAAALSSALSGKLTATQNFKDSHTNDVAAPPNMDNQERGRWPFETLPASWRWVSFLDFFEDVTESKLKLPENEYQPNGTYPVIDQGKQTIGGYTDRSDLLHPATKPVIVFGDHTRCVKLVHPPFVQGADGVKVLAPKSDITVEYARYALMAVEIPEKGYSRHMKFVRKTVWPSAPPDEREKIVRCLNAIFIRAERLEAETARARALLDRLEASILAKAFRGELVPQDPNDEPASVLLERIRAQRAAAPKPKRTARKSPATSH